MKTLVKIVWNKKFQFWEVLTAVSDKDGNKVQSFGNDLNWNSLDKNFLIDKVKKDDFFEGAILTNF